MTSLHRGHGVGITLAVFAVAAALGGCASYGPSSLPQGATTGQIESSMGAPTARFTLPDGRIRLEYARGLSTYMLDLNAGGQLDLWTQVLDERHFNAIVPGISREDLLRAIGRPFEIREVSMEHLALYNYRYDSVFCTYFQVEIDHADKVKDTGYGPDPYCMLQTY